MADPVESGGPIAWGWLVGLLVVVGLVVGARGCVAHVNDVMINGEPQYSDDELRDRPMLDEVMPAYVGAAEAVRTALVRAGATPLDGATVYEDAAEWAAAELPAEFRDESTYRGEQVVDDRVVRQWSTGWVDLALVLPPEVDRDELAGDLLAAVRGYGFGEGWYSSVEEWRLLGVTDQWGAELTVSVQADGRLLVSVRSGLHLCRGTPSVPAARPPRPTTVGPEPV